MDSSLSLLFPTLHPSFLFNCLRPCGLQHQMKESYEDCLIRFHSCTISNPCNKSCMFIYKYTCIYVCVVLFLWLNPDTFTYSLYESSINLVPKPDQDVIRRENYRPIFLMNIDVKILSKILSNTIQLYEKGHISRRDEVYFSNVKWFNFWKRQLNSSH